MQSKLADLDVSQHFQTVMGNLTDGVCFVDGQRRVIFWNDSLARLTGYKPEQIVGKSCCEDLLVHIDYNCPQLRSGSFPAALTLEDGQTRQARVYLRHRQGNYVPVSVRTAPLRDGEDGQIVGVVEVITPCQFTCADSANDQAKFLDPLTGLASAHYVLLRLQSRLDEMKRYKWNFGVIAANIDNLASLAASYGAAADKIVQEIGKNFAKSLRSFDVVGRMAEGEFVAIVPILEYGDLYAIGERIRSLTQDKTIILGDDAVKVTVSVGAAGAHADDTVDNLLSRARLWRARSEKAGGNCVNF
jgi:diguanylate cyclase (GGDEF)-like protein/PAS domain S-box-containing protein